MHGFRWLIHSTRIVVRRWWVVLHELVFRDYAKIVHHRACMHIHTNASEALVRNRAGVLDHGQD